MIVNDGQVQSLSQLAKLKDESKGNEMIAETIPDSVSTFTLMGNLFVSEGKPGKVSLSEFLNSVFMELCIGSDETIHI